MSAAFLRAVAVAALARAGCVSRPCALRLILVLCVLAVSSARISPVRAEPPRFSIVAPGIGHATFKVRPADATPFSGHAFKIDLDVAELRLVPAGDPSARRTVEQPAEAPHPRRGASDRAALVGSGLRETPRGARPSAGRSRRERGLGSTPCAARGVED